MLLSRRYHTQDINTPEIVKGIINELAESGRSPELDFDELLIIIEEALTNAIEHGNRWDNSKMISVDAYAENEILHIKITDEGSGFPVSKIINSINIEDRFRLRGWGLFMIKKLCKPSWNRKGNQIDLQVKII
jgi:anti-sigma regulatory factor (Ser/Thr protein kinase)